MKRFLANLIKLWVMIPLSNIRGAWYILFSSPTTRGRFVTWHIDEGIVFVGIVKDESIKGVRITRINKVFYHDPQLWKLVCKDSLEQTDFVLTEILSSQSNIQA